MEPRNYLQITTPIANAMLILTILAIHELERKCLIFADYGVLQDDEEWMLKAIKLGSGCNWTLSEFFFLPVYKLYICSVDYMRLIML